MRDQSLRDQIETVRDTLASLLGAVDLGDYAPDVLGAIERLSDISEAVGEMERELAKWEDV